MSVPDRFHDDSSREDGHVRRKTAVACLDTVGSWQAQLPLPPTATRGTGRRGASRGSSRGGCTAARFPLGFGGGAAAGRRVPSSAPADGGADRGRRRDMRTPRGRPPPGRAGKKGAVGPAFGARVATALEGEAVRLAGDGLADAAGFERLERTCREVALGAMAKALAAALNADRTDERGTWPPCPHRPRLRAARCPAFGGRQRRAGRLRPRTWRSWLGVTYDVDRIEPGKSAWSRLTSAPNHASSVFCETAGLVVAADSRHLRPGGVT